MSEFDDAHDALAKKDMEIDKEGADVQVLFRFQISLPGGGTFLCREYSETDFGDRTRLVLTDAWVNDRLLVTRMVPLVTLVVREYEIVTLAKTEVTV